MDEITTEPSTTDDPTSLLKAFATDVHHVYTVSGHLDPGSIADQIQRAERVVTWMWRARQIDERSRLLVVGGGAAGVAASLRASALGVPITLVEKSLRKRPSNPASALFGLQAGCSSRFLEPTAYSWPKPGWDTHRFPADDRGHMLRYSTGRASTVVARWRQRLNRFLQTARARNELGNFSVLAGKSVLSGHPPAWTRHGLMADIIPDGQIGPFGAILFAVGTGPERSAVGRFRSVRFWDDDDFDEDNLGCHAAGVKAAISGGSDGAIQDTIRHLFNPAFREIGRLMGELDVPPEVVQMIPGDRDDERAGCDGFTWLDTQCRQAAELYLSIRGSGRVAGLLRPDHARVHFLYHCCHVKKAYPLNRFLLHLLETVSRKTSPDDSYLVLFGEQDLEQVTCVEHEPESAIACLGHPHKVRTLESHGCHTVPAAASSREWDDRFQVVLMRHGADADALPNVAQRA